MNKASSPQHLSSEEWRRICAVLDRLTEIEPTARDAVLEDACRAEGVPSEQVRPFLEAHDQASRLPECVEPFVVAGAMEAMRTNLQRYRLQGGHRLGAYEITTFLGKGGMGEVYKARDTRLDRTVAIKILRSELYEDPDFQTRFEREARVISQLNHPNICTLHDVGHQDGLDFLIMEYVDGETLAARVARGPLPLDQVLRYGTEIADALYHAHRQGFVHRDLKPGNIILTKGGAKLLDFGLATLGVGSIGAEAPHTSALTRDCAIVGTLHYMAPEQVQGNNVDARTDIFALGAVLQEMLTGRTLWQGNSQAAVIAAILEREPPALNIQAGAPGLILASTIRTCLAKDPDERWQSAADVRHQLRAIASGLAENEQRSTPKAFQTRRLKHAWAFVAVAAIVAATLALTLWPRPTAVAPSAVSRFTLPPPDGHNYDRMHAIAPGARRIAFVAADAKEQRSLWIRALDAITPQRLAGTEGASYPFWSPDGRFIGFFADSALKKADLTTGSVETICKCDTGDGGGATWNKDGVILFSKGLVADTLWRVPASGGVPSRLSATPAAINAWPQFLPDGIHFLWLAVDTTGGGVYLGSLESTPYKRILEFEPRRTRAWYAAGFLFFLEERALMAQPFDTEQFKLRGDPVRIVDDVAQTAPGRSMFDVSGGVLAYREPPITNNVRLVWFDRTGRETGRIGTPISNGTVALSRDGQYLLTAGRGTGTGEGRLLLRIDTSTGIPTPFGLRGNAPVWAPDGEQFAFSGGRRRGPVATLASVSGIETNGTFSDSFIAQASQSWPSDWSSDGRYIVGEALHAGTLLDLWAADVRDDSAPQVRELLRAPGNQRDARISPDGRWLAYASDEGTGAYEVYVRPFPEGSGIWRVSTAGGRAPAWTRDGRELLYVSPEGTLMRAAVAQGRDFSASSPQPLFRHDALRDGFARPFPAGRFFEVSPDGRRVLLGTPVADSPVQPIIVVLNWEQLLTGQSTR